MAKFSIVKKKFSKSRKAQTLRMSEVLMRLSTKYPNVKIQLDHSNAFELLIATILSAQCTDARVNIVTKSLFQKYETPVEYLEVSQAELEKDIYSTGFYKTKAERIQQTCQMIIDDFDGDVPGTMEDLLKLPGVGRKTANVILGHVFDVPGIVVDTHVKRIANRLGFVATDDAKKIEFALMKLLPESKWVIFTHYLINHGRETCRAINPKCPECELRDICPSERVYD